MLRAGSMRVGLSDDDKEFYNAEKVLTKVASRSNGYDESMNHDEVVKFLIIRCTSLSNRDARRRRRINKDGRYRMLRLGEI